MEPATTFAVIASLISGFGTHNQKSLKKLGHKKLSWLYVFSPIAQLICKNKVPYQICVAQAALESGWGQHAPNNNYFGMTRSSGGYAVYSAPQDSIHSYCNSMYGKYGTHRFNDAPVKAAIWIWALGYADNDDYVSKLLGVMNLVYRMTGNEDFNLHATNEEKKLISKLRYESYGTNRKKLAIKLMD